MSRTHSPEEPVSESKLLTDWKLNLSGLDLGAVWENAIAQIGGIDLAGGKDLDATIAEEIKRLKTELEGLG